MRLLIPLLVFAALPVAAATVRPDAGVEARAHASFAVAERDLAPYVKLTVCAPDKPPVRRVDGRRLDDKLKALRRLERGYGDVVKLGNDYWTLASLYRLGYLYEELGKAITRCPANPFEEACLTKGGDDCELRDAFDREWRPMLGNVFDKALAGYRLAVERARALGVESDWTRSAAAASGRLEAAKRGSPPRR